MRSKICGLAQGSGWNTQAVKLENSENKIQELHENVWERAKKLKIEQFKKTAKVWNIWIVLKKYYNIKIGFKCECLIIFEQINPVLGSKIIKIE